MRNRIYMIVATMFLLALVCPFTTPAAPNQAAQGQFYMCRASPGLYQMIVTSVYPLEANERDIQIAWQNYAQKNYGPNITSQTVDCFTGTAAQLQQYRTAFKQQTSVARIGKFVDSDWKFTPDQLAAVSKPGAFYGYCESGTYNKSTIYFSDIFEVPKEDAKSMVSPIDKTFIPYLNKRYGLSGGYTQWVYGSGGCAHGFGSIADAQAGKQQMLDSVKKTNQHVVETGWKYARNADTPSAGPPASH